jgi:hypothetical protein
LIYHAIAILSGDRQKTIPNRSEEEMLSQVVQPFVSTGIVTAKWGKKTQSYQVLELRIFGTSGRWDKRIGPLSDHIKGKQNRYGTFRARAEQFLAINKPKVFVVMPIQGEKYGTQEQQRVHKEYDQRFEVIEKVVSESGGVAIRIDKEHPLEDLVNRIKREIRTASFIIADLTDERPSCYFEAGFAEALGRKVLYVASKQSVGRPGTDTKIHFDIHINVHFFTNHLELKEKLSAAIHKNRQELFPEN